ncbi:MAG: glycosyltransferase, partial [Elusimicrobia bacterium]|nr:glycosyltransferase [Elusimicrobiota bacterium]
MRNLKPLPLRLEIVLMGRNERFVPPSRAFMMVSLVIPTLNEAENILPLIKRLDEVLGGPREIIVVDDDSPDGTWKIATESAPLFPNSHLRVVRRRQDHGLARSLQSGLDVAR